MSASSHSKIFFGRQPQPILTVNDLLEILKVRLFSKNPKWVPPGAQNSKIVKKILAFGNSSFCGLLQPRKSIEKSEISFKINLKTIYTLNVPKNWTNFSKQQSKVPKAGATWRLKLNYNEKLSHFGKFFFLWTFEAQQISLKSLYSRDFSLLNNILLKLGKTVEIRAKIGKKFQ